MKDLIQWRRHGRLNKYSSRYSCRYTVHARAACSRGAQSDSWTDWQRDRECPPAPHCQSQGKCLRDSDGGGLVSIKSFLKMDDSSKWLKRPSAPPQTPHQKIDVYVQYPCFFPTVLIPPPQLHSILKLFCYVVGIISYDRSPVSVCVRCYEAYVSRLSI